jgi:hypothetical protein
MTSVRSLPRHRLVLFALLCTAMVFEGFGMALARAPATFLDSTGDAMSYARRADQLRAIPRTPGRTMETHEEEPTFAIDRRGEKE